MSLVTLTTGSSSMCSFCSPQACIPFKTYRHQLGQWGQTTKSRTNDYDLDRIQWFKVTVNTIMYGFRLSAVSFQLTGGTHVAFSVQNYLFFFSSKAEQVLSESLWDVPSCTNQLDLNDACKKLKRVALPLLSYDLYTVSHGCSSMCKLTWKKSRM